MDSSLQSALANSQQNNYLILAVITIIGYDYVLIFSREIEYVWTKPWTLVSTLFVIIRYLGLCAFITLPLSLAGPTLLSGSGMLWVLIQLSSLSLMAALPDHLPDRIHSCIVFQAISSWGTLGFIFAADLVMILRVWAMYNQSRVILISLLLFYASEIIPSVANCIVYSNPRNIPVSITHIDNFTFCTLESATLGWNKATAVTQLVHGAALFTLVIIQFLRRTFELHNATKQWRLNHLINLFVMEGVIYFLAMLAWNVVNALYAWGNVSTNGWQAIPMAFVTFIPMPTLAPRFVLNMRALYARNVQGGRGSRIDSGFGLSALSHHEASRSEIVFADGVQNSALEGGREDIHLEGIPSLGGYQA